MSCVVVAAVEMSEPVAAYGTVEVAELVGIGAAVEMEASEELEVVEVAVAVLEEGGLVVYGVVVARAADMATMEAVAVHLGLEHRVATAAAAANTCRTTARPRGPRAQQRHTRSKYSTHLPVDSM